MENIYIYLVKCVDKKGKITYYTGQTNNPRRRLDEHLGIGKYRGAKYTTNRKVIGMRTIYTAKNRKEATKWEKNVKKWPSSKKDYYYHEKGKEVK